MKIVRLLPLLWCLMWCLMWCLLPARAQNAATPDDTATEFQTWARRAENFDTGNFLYDRLGTNYGAPPDPTALQLKEFLKQPHPPEALKSLTRHPDSKVRTLALAALFARQDAHLLPEIIALVRDTAPTFATKPPPVARAIIPGLPIFNGDPLPAKAQTVGQIASQMVNFYLERTGYHAEGWPAYWAPRRERAFGASWFDVKLARASHGTSPAPADSAPALREIRAQIDALPRADRAWTLLALWIPGDSGSKMWASEAEVLAAARELGAPLLLKMLRGDTVSRDPDLKPLDQGKGAIFWGRMKRFVLLHPTQLLEPTMADALLEAERRDPDEPLWAQAAAELQPARAAAILKPALERFQKNYQNWDRGHLMATLWRLAGPQQEPFLLNWFWSEKPDRNAAPAGAPGLFLEELKTAPTAPTRLLVAHLLEDKRLESLPKGSFVPLVQLVNAWANRQIVDPRPFYAFEGEADAKALALKRDFIAKARAAQAECQG